VGSQQVRQAAPKLTVLPGGMRRVTPFGQVKVPASSSGIKSSMRYRPGAAGLDALGLMTAESPASLIAFRSSPVP
jgi:hypothetical protein